MAIEMIINKELGLTTTRAPWQGSYVVDVLADLVEEAVYKGATRSANAAARDRRNVFEQLIEAAKCNSLGRSATRCMTLAANTAAICNPSA